MFLASHPQLVLTIPHQRPHIRHARPIRQRRRPTRTLRTPTLLHPLHPRLRFARQTALVHLELDRLDEAQVRGDAVAGAQCDDVAGDELVGEDVVRAAGADDVAVVGDEFVEGGEGFLRTAFLNEADWEDMSERQERQKAGEMSRGGRRKENHEQSSRNNLLPVSTMATATVILTASSTLPTRALTKALPRSNGIRGESVRV